MGGAHYAKRGHRSLAPVIAIVVVVVAAVVGACAYFFLTASVPDVVGLNEAEAASALEEVGLVPVSESEFSLDYDAGLVTRQSKEADTRVRKGSEVVCGVSLGAPTDVPDVLGLSEEEAAQALEAAELVAMVSSEKVQLSSEMVDAYGAGEASGATYFGIVTSQASAAGETVPVGSEVEISVAVLDSSNLSDLFAALSYPDQADAAEGLLRDLGYDVSELTELSYDSDESYITGVDVNDGDHTVVVHVTLSVAAARRANLEVDPDANTDWNYEGTDDKIVYLTFDDGPSANTARILDILDSYGINATFFVTGAYPAYYYLIGEAYNRGNTIGLHTMTHEYYICYASVDSYFEDLAQIGEIVKEQIGFVPFLVRFPGGASNTVSRNYSSGIMTTLSQELIARGYQFYDWNMDSEDASGNNVPVDTIISSSCGTWYSNIILLMHDTGAKNTTVEALPSVIEWYLARGYTFAALDRSSIVVHHGINN